MRKAFALLVLLALLLTHCRPATIPEQIEEPTAQSSTAPGAILTATIPEQIEKPAVPPTITVVSPPSLPTTAPIIVTFACYESEFPVYEVLAEEFARAHPGITIRLKSYEDILDLQPDRPAEPGEYIRLLASAADTFTASMVEPWKGMAQGYLLNLDPLAKADPAFEADDFFPGLLEGLTRRGELWGLPGQVNLMLIAYNKDLFDQAGVTYPQIGWTWDDFLDKVQALAGHQGVEYAFLLASPDFLVSYIRGHGGSLVDPSTDPPLPTLDDPKVATALQEFADLTLRHRVIADTAQTDFSRLFELPLEGRVAMWMEPRHPDSLSKMVPEMRLGFVPFPEGEQPAHPVFPSCYYISAATAHPYESWKWIHFLTTRRLGEELPARRSVFESSGFREQVGEENAAAYLYALEHATPPLRPFRMYRWLSQALRAVRRREATVEEALAQAQAEALTYHSQLVEVMQAPPRPVVMATPTAAREKVEITFAYDPEYLPYRELASSFTTKHPNIRVLVRGSGSSFAETAAQADCFLWLGDLREESLSHILNLQPLLEAAPTFSLEDFYPQALEAYRWEGDLYAIPATMQVQVLFYNRGLLDAAGVDYPRAGWTWDDFYDKTLHLTQGEGETKQYGFIALPSQAIPFVYAHGGSLVNDLQHPTYSTLNAPKVVEAVRQFFDLAEKGAMLLLPEDEGTVAFRQRDLLISRGRVAMWMGMNLEQERFKGPRWGIAPLPLGDIQGATDFYFSGYFISANTKHPQECWEWLIYLTEHLPSGISLPTRRSLMASPTFEERVGHEVAAAYRATVEYFDSRTPDLSEKAPWFDQIWIWFRQALFDIAQGTEVGMALDEAQRKADAYVDCLRRSEDPQAAAEACFEEAGGEW